MDENAACIRHPLERSIELILDGHPVRLRGRSSLPASRIQLASPSMAMLNAPNPFNRPAQPDDSLCNSHNNYHAPVGSTKNEKW